MMWGLVHTIAYILEMCFSTIAYVLEQELHIFKILLYLDKQHISKMMVICNLKHMISLSSLFNDLPGAWPLPTAVEELLLLGLAFGEVLICASPTCQRKATGQIIWHP